jgi:hypothetical protein
VSFNNGEKIRRKFARARGGGRMERWGKMRETGDKGKKGEKGERKEKSCLFGITNDIFTLRKVL